MKNWRHVVQQSECRGASRTKLSPSRVSRLEVATATSSRSPIDAKLTHELVSGDVSSCCSNPSLNVGRFRSDQTAGSDGTVP
jgi:hypothetical protein